MKTLAVSALVASGALLASMGGLAPASATEFSERLVGGNENPPVVSDGSGRFRAFVRKDRIKYWLRYKDLDDVTQAHIHIANPGNNGGVAAFLCTNLGNAPMEVPPCPPAPAVVRGEISTEDVVEVTADTTVVLEAGDLEGLIRLIRQGATYVNVHTIEHPGGEIRGQINPRRR